jgi:hypothetical protein
VEIFSKNIDGSDNKAQANTALQYKIVETEVDHATTKLTREGVLDCKQQYDAPLYTDYEELELEHLTSERTKL